MRDGQELVTQVQNKIGLDAYHIYPDSRRFIPEAVLWGIASACVIEFIKGFVDFKLVGESAKRTLLELSSRFRRKDSFEDFVQQHDIKDITLHIIAVLPPTISDRAYDDGLRELETALIQFGLRPVPAKARATEIAKLIANRPMQQ
jgi:hypothetical protein